MFSGEEGFEESCSNSVSSIVYSVLRDAGRITDFTRCEKENNVCNFEAVPVDSRRESGLKNISRAECSCIEIEIDS